MLKMNVIKKRFPKRLTGCNCGPKFKKLVLARFLIIIVMRLIANVIAID